MHAPLVFRAILGLLMDLAIPASLGAFVMAGMRLRSEGGMNFEASGGFLKWLLWGCFLLSLPGVSQWLVQEWWLATHPQMPQIESFEELAAKFPNGLSEIPELSEERSGEVSRLGTDIRVPLIEAARRDSAETATKEDA